MIAINLMRKQCRKCGLEKSTTLGYQSNPRMGDGLMSWCKKCTSDHVEAARKANRPRSNAYRSEYVERLRQKVFEKLGRNCVTCGFDDPRALHIDHVNNDGYLDRNRIFRRRTTLRIAVLSDTEGRFQILCANCNMIKAHEHNKARRVGKVA